MGLFSRWLSSSGPVDPFAERAGGADVVFHAAGVRIRSSATDLRVPGAKRVSKAVSLHRGSVLVTSDHLCVSYRKYIAVDGKLRLDPNCAAQVSFDADGVHLTIDITRSLAGVPGKNEGHAQIDVVAPISAEVLEKLGDRAVAISPVQVSGIARRI